MIRAAWGNLSSPPFSLEYLCERGCKVAVVDADGRNADLHAVFSGGDFPTLQTDLREEDGWTELASFMESIPHKNVVVSLPAGIGDEVTQNRDLFRDALRGLRRSLVAFWVLNRTPHSVALLRPFMDHYADTARAMVAVRNLFFGAPERFARWNAAKTREAFLAVGGLEMNLDDLNDAVADATFLHLPPRRFSDDAALNYTQRMMLRRWLNRAYASFDALGDRLGAGVR